MKSTYLVFPFLKLKKGVIFLMALLLSLPMYAQLLEEASYLTFCEQDIVPIDFPDELESTLCELENTGPFDINIPDGTVPIQDIPKTVFSSYWGSKIDGKRIHIKAHFYIDEDLILEDCVIKVAPNFGIKIAPGKTLTLKNSKLFACGGVWEGISFDPSPQQSVINCIGTHIEDAHTAIRANVATQAWVNIRESVFNRNIIGVFLEKHVDQKGGLLTSFFDNKFTCTAPLNPNPLNMERSLAGLNLKGSPLLNTFPSVEIQGYHLFEDLSYGIYATGYTTPNGLTLGNGLYGKNYTFRRIVVNAIYLEDGIVDFKKSRFENCSANAVELGNANGLRLEDCGFFYDEDFQPTYLTQPIHPEYNNVISSVWVNKLRLGGAINIVDSYFKAVVPQNDIYFNGLHVEGSQMEAETKITVTGTKFDFRAGKYSTCIRLRGSFPTTSETHIFNNEFIFDPFLVTNPVTGNLVVSNDANAIRCDAGDKYNIHIYNNEFYGDTETPDHGDAIRLSGSQGSNNSMSDNVFPPNFTVLFNREYRSSVTSRDFENMRYCGNIFGNVANTMWFIGDNINTDLRGNDFIGGGLPLAISNGMISAQIQKGNRFLQKFSNVFPGGGFAACNPPNRAENSKFIVHTEQSIKEPDPSPIYTFYSPYFPYAISPDGPDFYLFEMQAGDEPEACASAQLTNPQEPEMAFYRSVADQSIGALLNDAHLLRAAEHHLYQKLLTNPNLLQTSPDFGSFFNRYDNTALGQLQQVDQLIVNNLQIPDNIDHQLNQLAMERVALVEQLEAIENQLASAGEDSEMLTILLSEKETAINAYIVIAQALATQQSDYEAASRNALVAAQQINEGIQTAELAETNKKEVQRIWLTAMINQAELLSETQIQVLAEIAAQCPSEGGFAVYQARGLLPACREGRYEDFGSACLPERMEYEEVIYTEERADQTSTIEETDLVFQIFPNPNKGEFEIQTSVKEGHIKIYDALGQLVKEHLVNDYATLSYIAEPGLYYALLYQGNQLVKTQKVIIAK